MKQNEIKVVGTLRLSGTGSDHIQQDYIYGSHGVAPALTHRDYKSPRMVLIYDKRHNTGRMSGKSDNLDSQ